MTLVYVLLALVVLLAAYRLLGRSRRRPPPPPPVSESLDDAVRLRRAGDLPGARRILDALDVAKGGGLRRFLRSVAAWESGDAAGARALGRGKTLPGGVPMTLARMQLAAALCRPADVVGEDATSHLARALAALGADDTVTLRRALTALLFVDPEIAALFLTKEMGIDAPTSTPRAAERFASVARGRDLFLGWGAERIEGFLRFWQSDEAT